MNAPSFPVRLTRRVSFSSGHRYWLSHLSREENLRLFGPTASPYSHGHNYILDVTVEGVLDSGDGMVLNIKEIDALLRRRVTGLMDGKSLNDETPPFDQITPTMENLSGFVWDRVEGKNSELPPQVKLRKIRLEEAPGLYVEIEDRDSGKVMTFTRSYEFAASHRLHVPAFSEKENRERFGKCNNRAGHGHNYILEVTVEGEPDPVTGMLVDLVELDRVVGERVVDRYDHKNLNEDVPELEGLNPTSELVAIKIFDLLKDQVPAKLHRVRLQETARNIFEVCAPA